MNCLLSIRTFLQRNLFLLLAVVAMGFPTAAAAQKAGSGDFDLQTCQKIKQTQKELPGYMSGAGEELWTGQADVAAVKAKLAEVRSKVDTLPWKELLGACKWVAETTFKVTGRAISIGKQAGALAAGGPQAAKTAASIGKSAGKQLMAAEVTPEAMTAQKVANGFASAVAQLLNVPALEKELAKQKQARSQLKQSADALSAAIKDLESKLAQSKSNSGRLAALNAQCNQVFQKECKWAVATGLVK